jgi:hypothetical protein
MTSTELIEAATQYYGLAIEILAFYFMVTSAYLILGIERSLFLFPTRYGKNWGAHLCNYLDCGGILHASGGRNISKSKVLLGRETSQG